MFFTMVGKIGILDFSKNIAEAYDFVDGLDEDQVAHNVVCKQDYVRRTCRIKYAFCSVLFDRGPTRSAS